MTNKGKESQVVARKYEFKDIFVNLFDSDETRINDFIGALESNEVLYWNEVAALNGFKQLLKDSGGIPTIDLFMTTFPDSSAECDSSFKTNDLLGTIRLFIRQRKNILAANALSSCVSVVMRDGVTPEISDEISNILKSDVVEIKYENIIDRIEERYEMSVENSGIKTGIEQVDQVIGGLKAGQVSVVAGFTGMGKSICSVSIMHAAVEQGYNVCYISLELSADHLMYNMISRHSLETKFSKKIEHRHLKSKTLSRTDWDYVKSDILPDLRNMPGKFYILDEQDIEGYNYYSFDNKLQEIENLCFKETGKGLDLIIVDHIQMLAFSDQGSKLSENTVINRWCNYFRSQCLDFLKSKRQIHVILVAQINRQGYLKAARNNGMYDMTALKEANEIETCASVILGIYSDTSLITSNQTKVGILKNRDGSRVGDAYQVPANYPYQLIGGVGSTIKTVMANATSDTLNNMFDTIDAFGGEEAFQESGGFMPVEQEDVDFVADDGFGINGLI
jgi:replicative DNA helicase|nr:MAG TPA: Helicase REPLICATION [Caudoviricetes sp.]